MKILKGARKKRRHKLKVVVIHLEHGSGMAMDIGVLGVKTGIVLRLFG